jgi:hypothetical protein
MVAQQGVGTAFVAALSISLAGCGCTLVDCNDMLVVRAHLAVDHLSDVRVRVRACRNDVCSEGTLALDGETGDGEGGLLVGDLAATASLRSERGREGASLEVQLLAGDKAGAFEDGDHVTLRVVDLGSGGLLIDAVAEVDYGSVAPNGRVCGPTCDYGEVEVTGS